MCTHISSMIPNAVISYLCVKLFSGKFIILITDATSQKFVPVIPSQTHFAVACTNCGYIVALFIVMFIQASVM